jgi:hypothetical protein
MKLIENKRLWPVILFITIFTYSCTKTNFDTKGGNVDKTEYELHISASTGNSAGKFYNGNNVSSYSWDIDAGAIFMGTDDYEEPLGTLTLKIDSPVKTDTGTIAYIFEALFSTSDKRVGTADEINGRLYELNSLKSYVIIDEVAVNYIKVKDLMILMKRVLVNQGDEPEEITVKGKFTVKKN